MISAFQQAILIENKFYEDEACFVKCLNLMIFEVSFTVLSNCHFKFCGMIH